MKKSNRKQKQEIELEMSATPIMVQPENVYELLHKYGTYEIQPTADSGNDYPTIAQGLPEDHEHPN
jgi:hypothetical protein